MTELEHAIKHIKTRADVWAVKEVEKALSQEPCADTISRDAVINTLDNIDKALDEDRTVENYKALLKECYEVLPSVTRQTGHWIAYEVRLPDRTILNYRCSVCGRKLIGYNTETLSEAPYCHCGARMVEPQESEE